MSLHSCPPRPVFQSDVVTLRGGAARSNADAPKPLRVECDDCGGEGRIWKSRYGGNDPDVWRVGPCEACDGTGHVEVVCEYCGDLGATEMLDGRPYHLRCAEEVMADLDPWRTSGPGFGT